MGCDKQLALLLLGLLCAAELGLAAGSRDVLVFSSSASSVAVSSSSSSFSSSSSGDGDGCGTTVTRTTASGGGTAFATGSVQGDCDVKAESTADSKGSETVTADATATAVEGKTAVAIAKAIGAGDGVDAAAEAIAKATKEGNGAAVAVAVADVLKEKCAEGTPEKDCPKEIAARSVVQAYASAENEAEGLSFAKAIAVGLLSDDKGVPSVFASATSKILAQDGCKAFKPVLSEARAIAVGDDKERQFVDALDFDIKIAECVFPQCKDDVLICCSLDEGEDCGCKGGKCTYKLFKSTPTPIWATGPEKCLCPSSV